ncbi:MAG: hypothetical protein ACFB00_08330 [Parvularculaceae bacterium]
MLEKIAECRGVAKSRARLRCYDAAAAALETEPAAAPVVSSGVEPAEAAEPPGPKPPAPQPIAPAEAAPRAAETDIDPATDVARVEVDAEAEEPRATAEDAAPRTAAADQSDDDEVDPDASFGAENLAKRDDERRRELRAIVETMRRNQRGKYIVELENGQVWRQIQGDTNELYVPGGARAAEAGGFEIIIKKRSLSAYALRLTTSKRSILVERIK